MRIAVSTASTTIVGICNFTHTFKKLIERKKRMRPLDER